MMRTASAFAVWMLGLVTLTGCADSGWDPDPEPLWTSGQGSRTVVPWTGDTLFHLDGRSDSLLLTPPPLRPTVAGLAVLDRVDLNVPLYSESGERLWTAGRAGQGPGEFDNVRDLRSADGGRLLVYDVGNGKVTALDVFSGELLSELRLPESVGVAESMVPVGDSVMFVTFRPEHPLAVVSLVDGSTDVFEMPWDGFERLSSLHRQGITAAEGARWVYLFRYGNGFFPFQGTRPLAYTGQYVEHQPFPALSVSVTPTGRSTGFADQPVCSACSASMVHDTLFVHFGGETEYAARVLDAYDVVTGEYLMSYELPTFFMQIEVGPEWIAGVRENPFPELLLLSR